MRIAILGGSFDPIHKGHLMIAKTALKKQGIDEVWFMPTKNTPLKTKQTASYRDRCEMVTRAIAPYRKMKLCTLEGELKGKSYTIISVKELKRRYPQHQFCWLIGDDQAKQFAQWYESEQLKKEVTFYVFSREEGTQLEEGLHRIVMPLMDISSTAVRNGSKLYHVPNCVRRYMAQHDLYLEQMVANRMNEKRFAHSKAVAQMCVKLANVHQLDERKAYVMGLVHDICKEMAYEKARIWMKHHLPDKQHFPPAIWHGYIGAYKAKHTLYIDDNNILSAIYHHVLGDGNSPYDKMLFIADKANPLRTYDCSKQIAIAMRDLDEGFKIVKKEQTAYLKQEGVME